MRQGEVSPATAKRDIEAMRYRLEAPIVYDKKLRAYIYIKEFKLLNFAGTQLLLFYILAKGLTKNPNYLPLTAEYSRKIIIDNINRILPDEYAAISDNFTYIDSDYEKMDFSTLQIIIESMRGKKQIEMEYLTKQQKAASRNIEPLKVICYGTKWYLFAYCHKRKDVRLFSLSRIGNIKLTDIEFQFNRDETDIDKVLNRSFGIAKGDELHEAVIRFYEPSSFYVKTQIWHSEQKIKEYKLNKEQILEMKLPYAKPEELIGKVLKYGATAEILKPASLRKLWLKEIEGMWKRYLR